ncbi:ArgE/DapE family deacylase [Paraburkholderia tropica]|uniref:Probable succinyl-diaminopimelate desuccinylase n=1 Tax=Paraburkholderia tropica TaxID=92647 RepID=A0ABX5MUE6_9BURK|nr:MULTISPECIES: ArgE/DapE family deacylase [Paraburkholderia]MBB2999270.1 acetylornithine deacetylase/succinyl-diaminopimelate desuccinylase family protein [Paraburkholderia tropica]MBB6318830.1 acetylornithine deacetylase/succinyl-diaminopimelate desuccinylase family protein [Paraburkholderia tropica]MDE1138997.1 ArgE/DapE family deacylase [Paraburkholderia tropica]PXX18633.1 acetylornithine deacetylase/succinyl-diaminopimelate desuccinylase family protein [Paraburkholderia tropica]PZW87165.
MTDAHFTTALFQAVDHNFDNEIAFLADLVRRPSDNPPGYCAEHAELTAQALEALGFDVERHRVPTPVVERAGMISATNLVVRHRFGAGPVIALNAHGDVVPPGEGWSADPYGAEIRDGWMYGRGAAVSKSDFATYAFALKALIDARAPLAGTVELHLTYDEESGGLIGPGWLLKEGIVKPDYAICAGFSYAITTAHNGAIHLEVTVRGKSAHAARPDTGHDALEAAVRVLNALYAHREDLRQIRSATTGIEHPTLVVGLIEGGINTNVVPDKVTFRLDRRVVPEESAQDVLAQLRAVIETAAALPGISVEIREVLVTSPLRPIDGAQRLTSALQAAAEVTLGARIPEEGVPLYTDARLYCEAGVPTVIYGAGPRTLLEANGHRADERVKVEDVRLATRTVALALTNLLGV